MPMDADLTLSQLGGSPFWGDAAVAYQSVVQSFANDYNF